MPDYVRNELFAEGKKEDIHEFVTWIDNNKGNIAPQLIPIVPDIKLPFDECEWRIKNWGTKWDADTHSICVSKDWTTMYIGFDTAWSPPIPMLDVWEERFPDLTFTLRYYEGGMWFMGENDNEVDLPEIPDDNEEQEEAHDEYVASFMSFTDDDVNPHEIIRIPLIEGKSYNA